MTWIPRIFALALAVVVLSACRKEAIAETVQLETPTASQPDGGPSVVCPDGSVSAADTCTRQEDASAYLASLAREVPRLEKACDGRVASACYELGGIHAARLSSQFDGKKALAYYDRACFELGHGPSCVSLAYAYARGDATEPMPELAFTLMDRGCKLGDAIGCGQLGRWYVEGREGMQARRDATKGLDILDRTCRQAKISAACFDLSEYYADGKFVKKAAGEAARYFRIGCDLNPVVRGCKRAPEPTPAPRQKDRKAPPPLRDCTTGKDRPPGAKRRVLCRSKTPS